MEVRRIIGPVGGLLLAWAALAAATLGTAPGARAVSPSGGSLLMVPDFPGSTAGDGAHPDVSEAAPDAAPPARRPVRSSQLSADSYRLAGSAISGGRSGRKAPAIRPGQYTDTIGPGETRWYAATLDSAATADLSVTAAPRPGAPVEYGDGLELALASTGPYAFTCATRSAHFGQDEGAMTLTGAVSRIPSHGGDGVCDPAGRYLLSVHRTSAAASDQRRWPIELHYGVQAPLPAGTTAAAARTDYGVAPAPLRGAPKDVTGGTGFNDATRLATGVWRDRLPPARTRYYKVHLGWGQQLNYTAQFANESVLRPDHAASFVTTSAYAPDRLPVQDAADGHTESSYDGSPTAVDLGTVPVTWTNRWVDGDPAQAVHQAGDYWIAIGLGPGAAQLAKDAAVGVVLRVQVTGRELAGPQYHAPALARTGGGAGSGNGKAGGGGKADGGRAADGRRGGEQAASDGPGTPGGVTGTDMIAAGTGGAVALAAVGAAALVHRARTRTDRSRA
jgi:Ca-activated chloride channel homolog